MLIFKSKCNYLQLARYENIVDVGDRSRGQINYNLSIRRKNRVQVWRKESVQWTKWSLRNVKLHLLLAKNRLVCNLKIIRRPRHTEIIVNKQMTWYVRKKADCKRHPSNIYNVPAIATISRNFFFTKMVSSENNWDSLYYLINRLIILKKETLTL